MTTAKQWSERVRRWKRSGRSAAEFAEEAGCNARTLAWWGWRLRTSGVARSSPVELVEVLVGRSRAASAVAAGGLEIEIGARVRVRVERGFDAELLRAVVDALEPK